MFTFGIEHEVAFLDRAGRFVDWTTARFADLDQIIAKLPLYPSDYPQLYVGDAGIRKKRWYIEGIERFSETGTPIHFDPKGIEIRTTIHPSIQGAVEELRHNFACLRAVAEACGFTAVLTSFNPYQTKYIYAPPLNNYEQELRRDDLAYQTEDVAMLTDGPDLNLALTDMSAAATIDRGRKLTAYSPYITPFSYSSPCRSAVGRSLSAYLYSYRDTACCTGTCCAPRSTPHKCAGDRHTSTHPR